VAITDGEGLAVYQGTAPCFFRSLDPAAAREQIQQSLAALEIGAGIRVERVLFHGRFGQQDCAGLTPVPVELELHGGLAAAFGTDTKAALDLAGAYAAAYAAAFGEPVNFRTGPLAYTRNRDRFRRKLRLTAILAAAVVLLLFAELGVRYFLVKKDLASLDGSIRTIYSSVFPNRKKAVDEVAELRSEIKRLNMGSAGSSALETMKQIALAKGDDISAVYELEIDGNQVRGKGDARSAQAATEFKTRTAKFLSGVEVSEIKSRPDGSVGFSFRATGKEGAK
jgi:general secretion pathway protein L